MAANGMIGSEVSHRGGRMYKGLGDNERSVERKVTAFGAKMGMFNDIVDLVVLYRCEAWASDKMCGN